MKTDTKMVLSVKHGTIEKQSTNPNVQHKRYEKLTTSNTNMDNLSPDTLIYRSILSTFESKDFIFKQKSM